MTPDGPEAPKSVWWLPMQQGRDMEKGGMVCGEMGWDGIGMVNGWDGMGWDGMGWMGWGGVGWNGMGGDGMG